MVMLDLNEVLAFAKEKHKGQFRDGGEPYVNHPIRVSDLVRKAEHNPEEHNMLTAAALLHDTLEDTDTSVKELEHKFGRELAGIIVELTNSKYASDYFGKAKYLSSHIVHMTPRALTIKLADRLDNILDMEAFDREKKQSTLAQTKDVFNYIAENRELTETHERLMVGIYKVLGEYCKCDRKKALIDFSCIGCTKEYKVNTL